MSDPLLGWAEDRSERSKVDPRESWTGWWVIESAHCRVHYPDELNLLGRRASEACEEAWAVLVPLFGHRLKWRVDISLVDLGDRPNGFANSVGWPRITLLTAPPPLDSVLHHYHDWIRLLVFHEFAHLLQIDQISGVPSAINRVIGRQLVPNQALPSAILEGGATWAESASTGRGRVHSALVKGGIRAQVMAHTLPEIDELLHTPERWPGPSVWYLHGGLFSDWLVRRYGTSWISRFHRVIGGSISPFQVNLRMRELLGEDLNTLYTRWQTSLKAQVAR